MNARSYIDDVIRVGTTRSSIDDVIRVGTSNVISFATNADAFYNAVDALFRTDHSHASDACRDACRGFAEDGGES